MDNNVQVSTGCNVQLVLVMQHANTESDARRANTTQYGQFLLKHF